MPDRVIKYVFPVKMTCVFCFFFFKEYVFFVGGSNHLFNFTGGFGRTIDGALIRPIYWSSNVWFSLLVLLYRVIACYLLLGQAAGVYYISRFRETLLFLLKRYIYKHYKLKHVCPPNMARSFD